MCFKKKLLLVLQILICLGWSVVLQGCQQGSVSLEEALLTREAESGEDTLDAVRGSTESLGGDTERGQDLEAGLCYVYVCGSVKEPGVYALPAGSRIVAAVEAAGGFLETAAREAVNLAAPVSDGMQITVPDLDEAVAVQLEEERQKTGKVNLNRAAVADLCTLSGIGESKAEAILAYREEIGAFSSIEQLKNVTGIGDSLFEQIKECVYIE